jgi:L-fuculose-phosphate aldolase
VANQIKIPTSEISEYCQSKKPVDDRSDECSPSSRLICLGIRFGIVEDIPVTLWAPRGSAESVSHIVDQLKAHPGIPAVLLGNHGLLAFGPTPAAAAQIIIIMEEAAEMTLAARSLGGAQPFPEGALEQEREHMRRFGSL